MSYNDIVQAIADASKDADTLEQVINGEAETQVKSRLGRMVYTLSTISSRINNLTIQANQKLTELQDAINTAAAAGAGANGWTDTLIAVSENINQRQINDGLESIAQLAGIKNPRNGQRVYVKSYHAGYKRGGGWFTFDSSKVSSQNYLGQTITNDKGLYINGWVRNIPNNEITPEMFGAYGEAATLGFDDYQAIEDMFQALVPCPKGTQSNPIALNDVPNAMVYAEKHTARLTSLYKHSKPVLIPPNITIIQNNTQSHWSRRTHQGLWYSPDADKRNSFAVGNYVYSKIDVNNADNSAKNWYLNTDVMFMPKFDAESVTYYALGLIKPLKT